MIKLIHNNSYSFRFIKNIHDENNNVLRLRACSVEDPSYFEKYFCYVLTDGGVVDCLVMSPIVHKTMCDFQRGFIGTSEGYYIQSLEEVNKFGDYFAPKYYYSDSPKTDGMITTDDAYEKVEGYVRYDDVVKYDPFSFFDDSCPYNMTIETSSKRGFLHIFNVGIRTGFLFPDKISYEGVPKLETFIENYKYKIENYKHSGGRTKKYIFGDDAHDYFWSYKKSYMQMY